LTLFLDQKKNLVPLRFRLFCDAYDVKLTSLFSPPSPIRFPLRGFNSFIFRSTRIVDKQHVFAAYLIVIFVPTNFNLRTVINPKPRGLGPSGAGAVVSKDGYLILCIMERSKTTVVDVDASRGEQFLTASEWLVLLPSPPSPPASISGEPAPVDPAGELRVSNPLSFEKLQSVLSTASPALALSVRLRVAIEPLGRRVILRGLLVFIPFVPLLSVPWVFNDGRFGTAQLAVGTVTGALCTFFASTGLPLLASYQQSLLVVKKVGSKTSSEPREFSAHSTAGLARGFNSSRENSVPKTAGCLSIIRKICSALVSSCNVRVTLHDVRAISVCSK
jgi:hypothetical protein